MIPLKRVRNQTAIHENFRPPKKTEFEAELLSYQRRIRRGEIEKHPFKSSRWKPAKDQLKRESNDKCAYCEATTAIVAHGDVEHYRPKTTYWWLAYCYDNYLFACQLCNQTYKKAKFPIQNRQMSPPRVRRNTTDAYIERKAGVIAPHPLNSQEVQAFEAQHRQERPHLLNPYIDDPTTYFAWLPNDRLTEVTLIPATPAAEPFCEAAIACYGLNRLTLKRERYKTYRVVRLLLRTLEDPNIGAVLRQDVLNEIINLRSNHQAFAGMVRYFTAHLQLDDTDSNPA